ncbi:MAG: hypothetical protein HYZ74_08485, partial [Elusimicrobia bacterium]|nr:hypothetical protein [Elusimicrobiota bacterium]
VMDGQGRAYVDGTDEVDKKETVSLLVRALKGVTADLSSVYAGLASAGLVTPASASAPEIVIAAPLPAAVAARLREVNETLSSLRALIPRLGIAFDDFSGEEREKAGAAGAVLREVHPMLGELSDGFAKTIVGNIGYMPALDKKAHEEAEGKIQSPDTIEQSDEGLAAAAALQTEWIGRMGAMTEDQKRIADQVAYILPALQHRVAGAYQTALELKLVEDTPARRGAVTIPATETVGDAERAQLVDAAAGIRRASDRLVALYSGLLEKIGPAVRGLLNNTTDLASLSAAVGKASSETGIDGARARAIAGLGQRTGAATTALTEIVFYSAPAATRIEFFTEFQERIQAILSETVMGGLLSSGDLSGIIGMQSKILDLLGEYIPGVRELPVAQKRTVPPLVAEVRAIVEALDQLPPEPKS